MADRTEYTKTTWQMNVRDLAWVLVNTVYVSQFQIRIIASIPRMKIISFALSDSVDRFVHNNIFDSTQPARRVHANTFQRPIISADWIRIDIRVYVYHRDKVQTNKWILCT